MNKQFSWFLGALALLLFSAQASLAQSPPTFTSSPPTADVVYNTLYNYDITTDDAENEDREIYISSGSLPAGLTLTDNLDGTAQITGTVTEVGSFDIELTVRQTGDNTQNNVQPVTINIIKATPVISWSNPGPITYGTALTATQLNATSGGIPGTFIYSPSSGTVLNAGTNQVLSVNFTPNDAVHYEVVNGTTVHITVNKATPVIAWTPPGPITYGTALSGTQLNASSGAIPGTFVYNPVSGTVLDAGTNQTLSVNFTPGDVANYNVVNGTTVLITVNKATPIITWNDPAAITYGTLLSAAQLNASSGAIAGTFVYNPASGALLNAGANQTLSVNFTPTDAANYNVVNGTTASITVNKATPVISWTAPGPITYGTTLSAIQLNATSGGVTGTFVYNPAAGTLLNAGANQTLSVNFTPSDATNYNVVNGTTTQITVNKVTPVISWTAPGPITYGTTLSAAQLNATSGGVAGTFVYNPAAGTLLSAGAGQTLSVNFTPTDGSNYNVVNGTTVQITVNKATPVITWNDPAAITYGTVLSATQLNASSGAIAGTFVYNPASGALLNAGANQTLSVNFTPTDAANYNVVNGTTASITVSKATPVISWTAPAAITYGTTLSGTQLNATSGGVTGTFVYNPAAGTLLNAGANQTLSVNFTPSDATNYNVVNGTTTQITVNKATPVISWTAPGPITYGTTLSAAQLNATSGGVAGTFVYNPAAGALLNAGANQTLSVNFTPTDATNYNVVNGTTTQITVNKATPVITWNNPAAITYGTPLGVTQLNAATPVAGTFAYSPVSGTVLNAGANQTLSANFTPTDATNYNPVTGTTVQITVNKATPAITWSTPAAITYGTALSAIQLNASSLVGGTFVYTPVSGTVLNAGAGQTLSANFTPTDGANYNNVNGTTVLITVNKATPSVTWASPAAITYGTALTGVQLNATSPTPGTFVYNPVSGTTLNAGANQTLSANFTPTDAANYNVVNGTTVQITVNKATPGVSWSNPAAITFGTPLGATQLNATATVAGAFVYTPASGTVLNAGTNQTLSVNFTPTDAVNYNVVNGTTVQITVNKATPGVTWANPAAITFGTPLGATQLNATATVAGTFLYSPASGTVLNAGANQILSVNFTPTDVANYNVVNGTTAQITVNKATPGVTWTNPAAITYGTPLGATQLNATATVGGTFVYTPVNGTVLNAGANQTLSVNFTPTDGSNYNVVNGTTVQITVNKATPVITWNNPTAITYGTPLGATQLNATTPVAGTFVYNPVSGTVLNAGANQTLSANFTPTDGTNYNVVNGTTVQITVNKATSVITWSNPSPIVFGTALSASQLNASTTIPGAFVYTPATGTVLSAGANQTLSVNFTPTDAVNYNSVNNTTVQLTVLKATPVITWANPASINYGTALSGTQLNATTTIAGTFVYSPASGTVLNAGANQTLSVNFTPTDGSNYNAVNGTTVQITVNKITPVVTWSNPAPITYGTPLSATQLNATANVPGTFSYAPVIGTVLNAGMNQALSVNFTPTDVVNYNAVNGTQVVITVNKATPVITWANPAAITFGTPLSATQLNATTTIPGTFTYVPAAGTILNAGANQNLSVNFTPADGVNFNAVNGTLVQITVNKATPVITWANPAAITYGTPLSATQLNATTTVGGTFNYTPASGTTLSAGAGQILSVDFTPTDAANYNPVIGTHATITVNKATPVITWPTPSNISYGTPLSATQLNASANVPGTFIYTPASGAVLNAGAGQTLSVNFSPTDNSNYSVVNGTTRLITVTKANPVVSWSTPLPIKVGVALGATQLNASANVPGTFVYTPPSGTVLPAGNNTLSVDFTPTDGTNYNVVNDTEVQITVSAKDNPVITWANPAAITYGTALSATQLNASANVPGTFTYLPVSGTILNAGASQTLTANFVPTDGVNYNSVSANVQITVNKAVLTATAANASRIYGAANPSFTINYTGFVNGDAVGVIDTAPTATCNATAASNAGTTFPIIPAGGTDNNYSFNYVNGTLTINKANLTAKADDKSRTYGSANPAFTITYTGFVNGDDASSITAPTAATPATPATGVGTYTITLSGGAATNYNFILQTGNLTIGKAPLTAQADDKSKVYGAANPAFTITYTGFLNGDASTAITPPTASTTATATTPVGTIPITLSGGTAANYTLTLQNGILTITQAPLTAKANNLSKTYGQANPTLTITYTGFVNSDNASSITAPTASTSAVTGSGAGTYPITLTGGSATNYSLTLQSGTLTVGKAALTAKADNLSRVYGQANPTFTITYTGFVLGDDATAITTPTASTTAVITSAAGTYPITLAGGSAANYNITLQDGVLTVGKAPLTAKADDLSRIYGQANPVFTITYTGFLNGDNAASITAPTASTTATITSNVGSYPITLAGGTAANYTITRQNGTLTIGKANPVVTWANPAAITYGTPLSITQLNATANVLGAFMYTPATGAILNAGASQTLSVNFTPTDGTNYNAVIGTTVQITVNKANPTIVWTNPAPITYGTLLSSTQLNATSVPGTFTYTPPAGTLLNAGANQVLSVDFAPTDASNYNAVNGTTVLITVNKANPVITWANPAPIIYGTPLSATQLNATANVPGTFSYAPGSGTVLNVGTNLALSVNFTPTNLSNYNVVNGTQVVITVNKATPVVSWANPVTITYGTALSGTQLNATATVPGTFTYTPPAGTVLNAGVGQTLSVNFTPTDGSNYNPVNGTEVLISVNKATPVITWANPAAITYGTALGSTQLNATTPVPGTFVYTPASGTILNAGTNQTLSVNFTPTDASNYNPVTGQHALITVSKAIPVITWATPASISYGTPLSATQLNASANVPGSFVYTPAAGVVLNAGANQTLSANFSPTDNTNYSAVNGTTRLITVIKANPVVTWPPPLPIKVGVALSATQLNASANVPGTFVYTPPSGTVLPAGNNQTLSVDFTPTDATNYNVVNDTEVQITVSVKDNPVITWANPAPIVYGTALSATQLNASANVPGTFTYLPAAGSVLNAGANQILTATFVPTDGVNYNSVNSNAQITVNKAVLAATAGNASRIYGAANPSFTINYTGFVNGDVAGEIDTPPTATCNATAASNAGTTFPIIPAGGADDNYTFNYVNGVLSINKANLTARPDNKSRSYGLANPTFTITYSGFVNGDNVSSITPPTANTPATQASNVGSYAITLSGGSATNYNFTFQAGSLTINISPLVASADDKSRLYGHVNPAFTIKYTGFLNGDNASSITEPAAATTAVIGSNVGTYPITLSGGSALNYGLILQDGTLTIGKAPLTATADDKTRSYGQANPANSITYTGFLAGDNAADITSPVLSGPAATVTSPVGVYPITLSGGAAANYNMTLQNGDLTIVKAPLRVTVQSVSRGYGLPNPAFTFTYNNADFVNGENASSITAPTPNTTATTASNVGTYPITLSGTTSNYDFVVTNGTLTITQATLTAKGDDKSKTYGAANPALTVSYNGFLNGDTQSSINNPPSATTTATTASGAGTYAINVSGGSSSNYHFSYVQGTLTINKATLTATANDQTRLYGAPNPTMTIGYTGFVNGDTPVVIDTAPTATTPATLNSPIGSYPIDLASGLDNNYSFLYVSGTLSITIGAAPNLEDFQVLTNEDSQLDLEYATFSEHFLSSPGDPIVSIKIVSLPKHGQLSWNGAAVSAGDEISVDNGVIENLRYVPAENFNGIDTLTWNAADVLYYANHDAKLFIKVVDVNDRPVLANIETQPILYALGDPAVIITDDLILSDVDDNFMDSARIAIVENFSNGDLLALDEGASENINPSYNPATGVLTLSGKESKSNYEAALHKVMFSSPITSGSTLVDKKVSITVNDSTDDSNIQSRIVRITGVFPDVSIVNAFTPNNDGVNDYWDFVNLQFYNRISIGVFDQNGVRVFECTDKDCKWDGKANGKDLPAGSYFYSIDLDNGKRKYQGTVTILK